MLLTLAAVVAAIAGALVELPLASLPKWLFFGFPACLPLYAPGFITQLVLLVAVVIHRPHNGRQLVLSAIAASFACWCVMASPGVLAWYTWEVVGDHTANIGAGLLVFAQTLGAPIAAIVVGFFCVAIESDRATQRDKPPNEQR